MSVKCGATSSILSLWTFRLTWYFLTANGAAFLHNGRFCDQREQASTKMEFDGALLGLIVEI